MDIMSDINKNNSLDAKSSFFNKIFNIEKWKKNKNLKLTGKQIGSSLKIISKTEKRFLLVLSLALIVSLIAWWRISYLEKTEIVPAEGGILKEVIIGQPKSLNPLFSQLNDADRDISEILYRSLLKYDEKGKIIEDLVEKYKINKTGTIYELTLKKGLLWSDGKAISADDVLFTIATKQDPSAQSPLRLYWQNIIKKVEKKDKRTVKIILHDPYLPFIENLTLKIIPKHIFEKIDLQKLSLAPVENIVSSGPYKVKELQQSEYVEEKKITKIVLERNQNFEKRRSFIDEIELSFVDELNLSDWEGTATNIGGIPPKNKNHLKDDFNIYSLYSPRYFALFLNQEKQIFKKSLIKKALFLSTPKNEIIEKVFFGDGRIVNGPFLPENNIGKITSNYEFDLKKAKINLEKLGWKDIDKDGILEDKKKSQELKFKLYTVNQKDLEKVASIIQKNWKKVGIKLEITKLDPAEITDVIKNRKYDILLFGQALNMKADPYPFWHSTQKKYPGLNLSQYENTNVDEIMEKSIKEKNENKRKKLLQSFQKTITNDKPAIFLYSPNYLYATKKEIKGINGKYIINPSKRFINIENWYIKEKRELKTANLNY